MSEFPGYIYHWYIQNRRTLPWRETKNPYKIWVSEIILQQTRVAQGTGYYLRFIEKFPTINALATADEDDILKVWQGLGYYTRARNMHSAAKFIVEELKGEFPNTFEGILKLKGVGNYTAAAIASIAFDLPHPAVDGNIFRLVSRYFGITSPIDSERGKKEVAKITAELMPSGNAGFHNQALMEFGALQCVPKSPGCHTCPLRLSCFALQNNMVEVLPVKSKKIKQTERFFYYYCIEHEEFIFLERRNQKDIWKGLYQFPLFESGKHLTEEDVLKNKQLPFPDNCRVNLKSISSVKKHILSHQIIYARLVHLEIDNTECLSKMFVQVNKKDISKFAVPKLLEEFIKELNFAEN